MTNNTELLDKLKAIYEVLGNCELHLIIKDGTYLIKSVYKPDVADTDDEEGSALPKQDNIKTRLSYLG